LALVATLISGNGEADKGAADGLPEGDIEGVFEIAAVLWAGLGLFARSAEDLTEEVFEAGAASGVGGLARVGRGAAAGAEAAAIAGAGLLEEV